MTVKPPLSTRREGKRAAGGLSHALGVPGVPPLRETCPYQGIRGPGALGVGRPYAWVRRPDALTHEAACGGKSQVRTCDRVSGTHTYERQPSELQELRGPYPASVRPGACCASTGARLGRSQPWPQGRSRSRSRTPLKMPGPVRTAVSVMAPDAADQKLLSGLVGGPGHAHGCSLDDDTGCQASTQAPSWRARPSASSRRRLTAATRSDHHRWLRRMPR